MLLDGKVLSPIMPNDQAQARYSGQRSGTISGKIIAITCVVFLIVAVFVGAQYLMKARGHGVDGRVVDFHRTNDFALSVSIDVSRKDTSHDSYCIVTALNYDKIEVGRREVVIPAGGSSTARYSTEIHTRDYPVAANLYGCADTLTSYLAVPQN